MALTGLLVLGACSDDDDAQGETEGTGAPDDTGADTTQGSVPEGDPIKIMTIAQITAANQSQTPEAAAAVDAAVEALNARGGVEGHPVEVITCDDKFDANTAAECARKAVDEGVVAVVGSATSHADAINPVLEEAGIAHIGNFPNAVGDFTSSISFPSAGSPALIAGCAEMLADQGAKEISVVHFDLPSGAFAATFAERGLAGSDTIVKGTVPVPLDAVDYSPLVASASDGTDGIILVLQPEMAARWVPAAAQQGVDVPQCAPGLSDEVLEGVGDAAEGILVANLLAPVASGGEGVDRFVEEVGEELSKDFYALNSWLGVQLWAGAIADAAPAVVDATSVLAAMNAAEDIDLEGVAPPYSTSTPGPDPLPRLFNPTYFPAVVEDGKIVSVADPSNPFEA